MKLCKDCKHYGPPRGLDRLWGFYGKCGHPENLDRVLGVPVLYAGEARSEFDPKTPEGRKCGPDARLFDGSLIGE